MIKLVRSYKILAATEILLLIYITALIEIYIYQSPFEKIIYITGAAFCVVPWILNLRIIYLTEKSSRATDTFHYTTLIFNCIKLIPLLYLLCTQTYFFATTIGRVKLLAKKSLLYDSLLLSNIFLMATAVFTFTASFALVKDNKNKFKELIQDIDKLNA